MTAAQSASRGGAETAVKALAQRQARALGSLLFRVVALTVLATLLSRTLPGLRAVRPLVDALCGVLALLPFFGTWGDLARKRIALGRACVGGRDWAGAAALLGPFGRGLTSRLFDAAGEGRYHLATARRELGHPAEAAALYRDLAAEVGARSAWGRLALEASGIDRPHSGASATAEKAAGAVKG